MDTPAGRLRGVRSGGVTAFRGIPYALVPRFEPPLPVPPWAGVRDAARYGPRAPQPESAFATGLPPMDEDGCLTVNVWAPAAAGERRLPVLVWLHGGVFTIGSGADETTDGGRLAGTGDVVVVTVNYRLGALGFLHLGELLGQRYASSGTIGLQDQIAALRWVRDSIAAFGGDPGNVTVFGQSAGAASVADLLVMPAARGLFHRALLQSGPTERVLDRATADGDTRRLLALLGLADDEADRLPKLPTAALLDAQRRLIGLPHYFGPNSRRPLQPVVDEVSLPMAPLRAARTGQCAPVPVLIGTTAEEAGLMRPDPWFPAGEADLVDLMAHDIEDAPAVLAAYRELLPGASAADLAIAYVTDAEYRVPTVRFADALTLAGGSVWNYLFAWGPDHGLGACHSIEIPFAFDNLDVPGQEWLCGPNPPRDLATRVSAVWRSFAADGVPGWAPYGGDDSATMVFDTGSAAVADPHAEVRAMWSGFALRHPYRRGF